MAKFYGTAVKTGKVDSSVFSIRFGETIERQYQPIVANPSTAGQVAARAKLKLMSQLSAVLAPVIPMRRIGNVSSRNRFVKMNYDKAGYANNEATVDINSITLTGGSVALPNVTVRRTETNVVVALEGSAGSVYINRVVYVLLVKQNGELRLRDTAVESTAGTGNTFTHNFSPSNLECVVLAYGIRDNTDAARTIFGNIRAMTASQVASLIVSRTLTDADLTLTETKGATA